MDFVYKKCGHTFSLVIFWLLYFCLHWVYNLLIDGIVSPMSPSVDIFQ